MRLCVRGAFRSSKQSTPSLYACAYTYMHVHIFIYLITHIYMHTCTCVCEVVSKTVNKAQSLLRMYAEHMTDSHFIYICIYVILTSVCFEIMRGFSI